MAYEHTICNELGNLIRFHGEIEPSEHLQNLYSVKATIDRATLNHRNEDHHYGSASPARHADKTDRSTMKPAQIENPTRTLAKPKDWDDSKGVCGSLPIRDELRVYGNVMISAWTPSPEELALLNKGAPVLLSVCGNVHPPVSVYVE